MSHYTAAYIMDAEASHRIAAALVTAHAREAARVFGELKQIPVPEGYESRHFMTLVDYLASEKRINLGSSRSFADAWPPDGRRFLDENGIFVGHVLDAECAKRAMRLMEKYGCDADDCHGGINSYYTCDAHATFAAYSYLLTILTVAQLETRAWVAIISGELPN